MEIFTILPFTGFVCVCVCVCVCVFLAHLSSAQDEL